MAYSKNIPLSVSAWIAESRWFILLFTLLWGLLSVPSLQLLFSPTAVSSFHELQWWIFRFSLGKLRYTGATAAWLTLASGPLALLGCFVYRRNPASFFKRLLGMVVVWISLGFLPNVPLSFLPMWGVMTLWYEMVLKAFVWFLVAIYGMGSAAFAVLACVMAFSVHGAPFALLGLGFLYQHKSKPQRAFLGNVMRSVTCSLLFVIIAALFLGAWKFASVTQIQGTPALLAYAFSTPSPPWTIHEIVAAGAMALVMAWSAWETRSLYLLTELLGLALLEGAFFLISAAQPSPASLQKPTLIMAAALALWVVVRGIFLRNSTVIAAGGAMVAGAGALGMLWLRLL